MSIERNKIIKFCEEYLKVGDFQDYCVNGLQVEGMENVEKIITGVSLSQKLIESAIEKNAKMIIVHHGIFMNMISSPAQIKGIMRNRLKLLLENDINLLGFHLPLDAHPEIGNNISLVNSLNLQMLKPFSVGYLAGLEKKLDINEFVQNINSLLGVDCYVHQAGPKEIKNVIVSSGGASVKFEQARAFGADTLLCGDIKEEVIRGAEEIGINIINAGHYNTEKFGVKNLGELLSEKFKIEAEFIDIPCAV